MSDLFFHFPNRPRHLAQSPKSGNRVQPFAVVEGGNAGNDFAVFDIMARRRFRRDDRVVADA